MSYLSNSNDCDHEGEFQELTEHELTRRLRDTAQYAPRPTFREELREDLMNDFVPARTPDDPLLKIADVCQILRVDRTTVSSWIHNGKLKAIRLGKKSQSPVRIRTSALKKMLGEEV